MMPGAPGRRRRDYVRHDTASLSAAFNIADGAVTSRLRRHHRTAESGKFLVQIDKAVPAGLGVHLVCSGSGGTATRAVHGTSPGRVAGSPAVRGAMG